MSGRTIPRLLAPALLAGVMLFLIASGGCEQPERKAVKPAGAPIAADRAAPGKEQQSPYFHGLIEEYRNVLAEDPHNLAAIIALGNALYDAGQWREAIKYYEQALAMNPHLADVVTDMGTCYRNLGMPDKAIDHYDRALKIEPVHQGALYNMGVVYGFDRKQYAKAIQYWQQLLHVAPKHPKSEYIHATMAQFRKAMREQAN